MTWRSVRRLAGSYLQRARGEGVGAVLVRGFGGTLGVNLAGTGLAFLVQVLLARLLGASGYGVFVYAFTWTYLLTLGTKLGLDVASLRFVSAYRAAGEWGLLRGYLRSSARITLLVSVAAALVVAAAVWLLEERLGRSLALAFWISCPLIPVFALVQVQSAHLQALQRVVHSRLSQLILRPALLAVLVLAFVAAGGPISAPVATALNLIAFTAALVFTNDLLRRKLPLEARVGRVEYDTGKWLRVALPLMLITGMGIFVSQVGTILTGLLLDTTQAGIYSVASRVALVVVYGYWAVDLVAAPMISELHTGGRKAELRRVLYLTSLGGIAFALPIVAGVILLGRPVLDLFGPGFAEGYLTMVILTVGHSINALTGSVQTALMMTGNQGMSAQIVGASAVLLVVFGFLLIPVLGIEGAAVASLIVSVPGNIAFWYYARRRLGLAEGSDDT